MLQVYLVRHGETVWNAARRIQGQSDSPLTEKGEQQGARLQINPRWPGSKYRAQTGMEWQRARQQIKAPKGQEDSSEPKRA